MKRLTLLAMTRLHYLLAFVLPHPVPALARLLDRHVLAVLER